jgi:hypothetical protein
MNETDGPDRDEELDRARLRELDPAASLAPADPDWVARLLEDTMSHDVDTPLTHESRENGTHDRSPLTWLVAAAAILVIAGVGVFATMWQEDNPDNPPSAAPSSSQGTSVLELSARPPVAAKCMVPTAEILANQQTAFDGTVASITDGVVTLDVTHWYLGGSADQVIVTAPPTEMQALVLAVDFQVGQRYLVSANDGFVTVCGFTAAYNDDLAAMYAEAFGN